MSGRDYQVIRELFEQQQHALAYGLQFAVEMLLDPVYEQAKQHLAEYQAMKKHAVIIGPSFEMRCLAIWLHTNFPIPFNFDSNSSRLELTTEHVAIIKGLYPNSHSFQYEGLEQAASCKLTILYDEKTLTGDVEAAKIRNLTLPEYISERIESDLLQMRVNGEFLFIGKKVCWRVNREHGS